MDLYTLIYTYIYVLIQENYNIQYPRNVPVHVLFPVCVNVKLPHTLPFAKVFGN